MEEKSKEFKPKNGGSRAYMYAWIFGLIFSLVFTLIIFFLDSQLDRWFHLPDLGSDWYYWQLPQPVLVSQIIVWSLYLAHQISIWILIYWAQTNYEEFKYNPTSNLTKFNWLAFTINIGFITLHLIQTHIWYDGLAQDVPIMTSQGSVIVMLAILLVMQNPRRGLIAGKKAGKPMTGEVSAVFRHNHVYIFSWALIYTFWFHPMDGDPQLTTGFFYMFLLLTQISLAYTRMHVNIKWVTLLEAYVAIHGTIVAIFNELFFKQNNIWPMFMSGFLGMIIITYMHGIGLKKWAKWLIFGAYIGFIIWLYVPAPIGYGRNILYLARLEMLWIPIVLYALAFLFAVFGFAYVKYKKEK